MRIVDGNIFEAMRLVLPEHREAMKRAATEEKKRSQPVVDEHAWSEMEYVLQEAMEQRLPVTVTLFHPLENQVLIGELVMRSGSLWLRTEAGTLPIDMRMVVRITLAD